MLLGWEMQLKHTILYVYIIITVNYTKNLYYATFLFIILFIVLFITLFQAIWINAIMQ